MGQAPPAILSPGNLPTVTPARPLEVAAPDRAWDLSGWESLQFTLANGSDVPVTVFARAENATANGLQDTVRNALELGPKGITVNTIPPGFVDTPLLRASAERGELGQSVDYHAEQTPVRRAGRPEDIANACSFLVSEHADYITGQVIGVNGGRNTG